MDTRSLPGQLGGLPGQMVTNIFLPGDSNDNGFYQFGHWGGVWNKVINLKDTIHFIHSL